MTGAISGVIDKIKLNEPVFRSRFFLLFHTQIFNIFVLKELNIKRRKENK
jgi:hypothetical protein